MKPSRKNIIVEFTQSNKKKLSSEPQWRVTERRVGQTRLMQYQLHNLTSSSLTSETLQNNREKDPFFISCHHYFICPVKPSNIFHHTTSQPINTRPFVKFNLPFQKKSGVANSKSGKKFKWLISSCHNFCVCSSFRLSFLPDYTR